MTRRGRGKPGLEFLDFIYPLTEKKRKKMGWFLRVVLFYKLYSRLKTVLVLHVKTVWTGFMGPTVSRLHICMRKRNEKNYQNKMAYGLG